MTMFTITYEGGRCTSTPFDETIFDGLDNTIVHVLSDKTDYTTRYQDTVEAVISYISKVIGKAVCPCGTHYYHEGPDGIELELFIKFH